MTGMRVQTASPLRLGERYAFGFKLPPTTKPINVELRALHMCLEPSQPETYGFRIERLAQRDVRLIKQFILEQMSVDQRRVIQKAFKHLSTTVITPFTQWDKVEGLLARAMASSAIFTLVQEDKPQAVSCLLQDISVHGLKFRAADDYAWRHFDIRVPVILAFSMEFNAYHGETVVTALEEDCIVAEFPKTLFFSEKRSRERETIPAPGKVLLEIELPYPKGNIIQREVLDLSSTGLSFKTSPSETYFLPGTPLRQLRIVSDGKTILEESGEVKHVAPMIEDCESESLRIGVEFLTQQPAIVLAKNTVKVEERTGEERRAGSRRSNDRRAGERRQSMLENLSEFTRKIASQGLQLYRKGWQAPVEPNSDAEVGIVRYCNRRNEEIVAIVNSTGDGRRRIAAPVVIIPPAYGRRKESTGALAMTLVENFRRLRRDLVVLRFDGVRSIGESYKDRTCRYSGKEMINMTLSQGMEDILTTLDYVFENPDFTATETILVSFSLAACMARKAILADSRQRVSYWLSAWGSPDAQSTIRSSTGGVDFIGNYQRGISCGVTNVLGHLIDNDRFCSDAIRSGMAFLEDAKRDMAKIGVPVTWIYGQYDEWIDPLRIREIMRVKAPGTREVLELSTGHMPTTSDEAMEAYLLIANRIWRHLFREEVEIRKPSRTSAIRLRNAEWGRTPKHSLKDQADYWETYLLGQGHLEVGFDVMAETEEHQQFMREQIECLDIRPGESVADFGGGTGLFHQSLLSLAQTRRMFQEAEPDRPNICSVDFVEAALDKSKARVSRLAAQHGVAEASFSFQLASLEVSRFKPIWRFLNGHYFSVEKLKGKIEGLPDYSIDLWHADYSEFLHAVLRGKQLDVTDVHRINKEFALGETEILLDMNLAARFVRRRLEARDFRDPHTFKTLLVADVLDYSKVNARHLNFKKLIFRSSSLNLNLDFQAAQFDKMLCSTVLSYLFNPLESLLEFERILKPGGRLVISTFRPDVDMSRIYTRLIQKIESDPRYLTPNEMAREDFLNAVRAFANSAAFLIQLEEEGSFKFFSREELRNLLEEAGFKNILLSDSFGEPHQAYVAVCTK